MINQFQSPRSQSLKRMTATGNSSLIVDFLPEPGIPVIIHCEAYECLGYLDKQHIWRNQLTNTPIENRVVGWSML